jgi:uncharacterized protein YjlB
MNRKKFLALLGATPFISNRPGMISELLYQPDIFYFKDDGKIPNSKFPLLLYHGMVPSGHDRPDQWYLEQFASQNWSNAWTNGIYGFHHYHSTSHEVLGIFSGSALLHLGGEQGEKVEVVKGDIIVIPAGVGHKKIKGSNLGVVGAYPDGRDWDLLRGLDGERPQADENIRSLPVPSTDPILGPNKGLTTIWM